MESAVLIVTNAADSRRYRLSIKGSLGRVTGAKVKKYMVAHVQAPVGAMVLKFEGRVMADTTTAEDMGVKSGDNLVVEVGPAAAPGPTAAAAAAGAPWVSPGGGVRGAGAQSVASSIHQQAVMEAETLDEQRGLFEQEAERRQHEYQRTLNGIAMEMSEKERQAALLNNELKEMQLQAQRVQSARQAAAAEKQRIEDLRLEELRRERQRDDELRAREAQLLEERERHRQLELHRLDLEQKQQLLEQQRAQAAAEKARVERDRREYEEQIAQYERQVHEKQTQLERERAEHARRERELQHDMAVLQQKKNLEKETVGKELELDELRLRAVMDTRSRPRDRTTSAATLQTLGAVPSPAPQAGVAHVQATPQALGVGVGMLRGASSVSRGATQDSAAPDAGGAAAPPLRLGGVDSDALAHANLEELGLALGQPLGFDASNTCVVDVDEKHTVMISYDKDTEALYIYSSLLCNIPRDPHLKVQLYELILEGALLGRDMAGGGVGLSLKDDFVLMCTSIPLHYTTSHALRLAFPQFSEALRRWRGAIKDVLTTATPTQPPPQPQVQVPLHAHDPLHLHAAATPDRVPASTLPRGATPWDAAPAPVAPPAPVIPELPAAHAAPVDYDEYAVIGVELTDGVTIDGVHTQYGGGVIVVRVKGPAAIAGIEENDVIKVVNGRPVTDLAVFQEISKGLIPEAPAYFVVERGGEELTLELRPQRGYRRPGEQRKYRVAEEMLARPSGRPVQTAGQMWPQS